MTYIHKYGRYAVDKLPHSKNSVLGYKKGTHHGIHVCINFHFMTYLKNGYEGNTKDKTISLEYKLY